MKLLKWLLGNRKPAFNKPVVSGSDYLPFEGKDIYNLSVSELNELRWRLMRLKYLPYNDVVVIENELVKRGEKKNDKPLFMRMSLPSAPTGYNHCR